MLESLIAQICEWLIVKFAHWGIHEIQVQKKIQDLKSDTQKLKSAQTEADKADALRSINHDSF